MGRRDDEDVPDARQHKRGQGVVDHRLVVDRKQLLADDMRHRMQPGAGPAGENYALQHRGGVSWALVRPISGTASARDARQDLAWIQKTDRKSVVKGKCVSVRVSLGGCRIS